MATDDKKLVPEDDDSQWVVISHWPGDWPGRRFVNLDCVGDPGDWLDLQMPSAAEVVLGAPAGDEEMAEIFADAYLRAGEELGFPVPTDRGVSQDATRRAAIADFIGFIREWRRREHAARSAVREIKP